MSTPDINPESIQPERELLSRNTLDVAKAYMAGEPVTELELRTMFISVWTAANAMFSDIYDIYTRGIQNKGLSKKNREILEGHVRSLPTAWNIPLEVRVPIHMRGTDLTERGEEAQQNSGVGPVVVNGYNDPATLEKDAQKTESKFTPEQEAAIDMIADQIEAALDSAKPKAE